MYDEFLNSPLSDVLSGSDIDFLSNDMVAFNENDARGTAPTKVPFIQNIFEIFEKKVRLEKQIASFNFLIFFKIFFRQKRQKHSATAN